MDSDAVLAAGIRRGKEAMVYHGNSSRTPRGSHPDWVMFDCFLRYTGGADSSRVTLAYENTSGGDRIGVGLRLVPPPSVSSFLFDWRPHSGRAPTGSQDSSQPRNSDAMAVAAHRGSCLLRFLISTGKGLRREVREEFFVYQVACPRSDSPPSLRRLPDCPHRLVNHDEGNNIGILCREDSFVVAHLEVTPTGGPRRRGCPVTAVLCYISSLKGSLDRSWCEKRLPIHVTQGTGEELIWWETDMVVPFDDCICWVDYLRGVLFCNVFSSNPVLLYLPLPVDPYKGRYDPDRGGRMALSAYRSVCVTKEDDGRAALRFVDVSTAECWFYGRPRRGSTASPYSAVTSWRLGNNNGLMWMEDGMIEYDEFLALVNRHSLRCTQLEFPLVDIKDPHTIYFAVREREDTFLLVANLLKKTLARAPYTFGSLEPSGEDDSCKDKNPRNLDWCEPFLAYDFACCGPSGEATQPSVWMCLTSRGMESRRP